jgi:hypothetical protein
MSPYPIDIIVVAAQYKENPYCTNHGWLGSSSGNPDEFTDSIQQIYILAAGSGLILVKQNYFDM